MPSPPAVLLLDDGELDRFAAVLRGLGVEHDHLRGRQIGHMVEKPTDLLITSLNRAVKLPEFESVGSNAPEPIRICVHQQDFLPLRERLRKLGIHFLIHSQIDLETLRLLFLQLLHQGAEQRGARRVPFGCQVAFWGDGEHHSALLAELSLDSCRMVANDEVRDGTPVVLHLPRALSQHGSIELRGKTLRCTPCERSQDVNGFNVAVEFDHQNRDTQAALEEILSGRQLGTRVTPLSPIPEPAESKPQDDLDDPAEELPEITLDRRRNERRSYNRRVSTLGAVNADAPQVVLARDLSLSGVRIARHAGLEAGSGLVLAIYGHEGASPVVLEAEVANDEGDAGLGLRFVNLRPEIRQRLQEIMDELPELEALENDATHPDRVFVSKVLPNED
jgi:hypothetical protein